MALTLPSKKATKRIDVLGVVLLSAATTCLIFFTEFGGQADHGWGAGETWLWGAGVLVAVGLFVFVESRADDPIIPLSFFRNKVFVLATGIGFVLGIGMFSAIAFVPTFLQMSSGASAAVSGLLLLPMMAGLIGTSILSGNLISKTGRYRIFPIVGTILTGIAMLLFTTLTADTPLPLICVFLFVFGAGLGLIMQVVVLVVQNSVDAANVGTATSTNNYFREVGAALGVAVFGAMFTSRLTSNLTTVFTDAGHRRAMRRPRRRPSTPPRSTSCPRRSAARRRGLRRLARPGVRVPRAVHRGRADPGAVPAADRAERRGRDGRPGRGRLGDEAEELDAASRGRSTSATSTATSAAGESATAGAVASGAPVVPPADADADTAPPRARGD